MLKIEVGINDGGQRTDRFLKKYFGNASLSHIYKMIRKDIKIQGKRPGPETILSPGDVLCVYISEEEGENLRKTKKVFAPVVRFNIAYEDEDMLIAEKPFGLLIHGDAGEKKNTLANQVLSYLKDRGEYAPEKENTFRPAPVNRLDRNTTGLVIFGKNAEAMKHLNRLIREREGIRKYYLTIVYGRIKEPLRLCGRLEKDTQKNTVRVLGEADKRGVNARTIIKPIKVGGDFTLTEAELITGRTHQIRAHLLSAGFPLIGDPKYGDPKINAEIKKRYGLSTQLLHAYKLEIQGITVTTKLPDMFEKIKKELIDVPGKI
jgi:23S rRNA pseudouridine955/2504/2580 synthase